MDNNLTENAAPCALCKNHIANTFNCKAFPKGIPDEIILGENKHTEPFPGDHGIQFEPREDEEEEDEVEKTDDWRSEFEISKVDESAHQVFGWFSVAEDINGNIVIDKQGDFIMPEDLEIAAYDYVLYAREAGEMHDKTTGIGKLIASIVTTKDIQKAMGINTPIQVGWFGGFQISDEAVWSKIIDKTYSMFSIGGKGQREEVNDD